jgi:thiosulfate/3-mercaptopyruvate sulfurtransferase
MLPLFVALFAPAADPAPAKYAKPDLLVEVADVSADKHLLLDVRGAAKYEAGHIPGAANANVTAWAKAIDDGKADGDFWGKTLARLGVDGTKPVVLYSDDIKASARGWWALKLAGVPDVRLLNGGWDAYTAAKKEVSKGATTPKEVPAKVWKEEPRLAVLADVVKLAEKKEACIVDARSAKEVADGKVPGAKPLEWTDLLDEKAQKFKPAPELIKLFDAQKIDLGQPCVTYCQGGGRAAVMAFALELMGAKGVKNYHKSWGEYGSEKTTPKEK